SGGGPPHSMTLRANGNLGQTRQRPGLRQPFRLRVATAAGASSIGDPAFSGTVAFLHSACLLLHSFPSALRTGFASATIQRRARVNDATKLPQTLLRCVRHFRPPECRGTDLLRPLCAPASRP